MHRLRLIGFCLMAACAWITAGAQAQTIEAAETQVSEVKSVDEAQAYLAWKRGVTERLLPESTTTAAARDYVQRTRGVGASDFRIATALGKDATHVYRVTLSSSVEDIPAIELVFDVIVDASTGNVLGEHAVRPGITP